MPLRFSAIVLCHVLLKLAGFSVARMQICTHRRGTMYFGKKQSGGRVYLQICREPAERRPGAPAGDRHVGRLGELVAGGRAAGPATALGARFASHALVLEAAREIMFPNLPQFVLIDHSKRDLKMWFHGLDERLRILFNRFCWRVLGFCHSATMLASPITSCQSGIYPMGTLV
jgi:hypothetical protein